MRKQLFSNFFSRVRGLPSKNQKKESLIHDYKNKSVHLLIWSPLYHQESCVTSS